LEAGNSKQTLGDLYKLAVQELGIPRKDMSISKGEVDFTNYKDTDLLVDIVKKETGIAHAEGVYWTVAVEDKNLGEIKLDGSVLSILVFKQKSAGFWDEKITGELLNLTGKPNPGLSTVYQAILSKCQDGTLPELALAAKKAGGKAKLNAQEVLTLYVLAVLRMNFKAEIGKWKLVAQKSERWLKEEGVNCGPEVTQALMRYLG
jgi:hypothetical protein